MSAIIRVYGLGDGTEFGRPLWVATYDVDATPARQQSYFHREGAVINGVWGGVAYLTIYRGHAMRFANTGEAIAAWNTASTRRPLRPDGKPNKPLTALTVEVEVA